MFKWSPDDQYVARCQAGKNGMISVYETPSMRLLDKKSIKVDDIVDFDWVPGGVRIFPALSILSV